MESSGTVSRFTTSNLDFCKSSATAGPERSTPSPCAQESLTVITAAVGSSIAVQLSSSTSSSSSFLRGSAGAAGVPRFGVAGCGLAAGGPGGCGAKGSVKEDTELGAVGGGAAAGGPGGCAAKGSLKEDVELFDSTALLVALDAALALAASSLSPPSRCDSSSRRRPSINRPCVLSCVVSLSVLPSKSSWKFPPVQRSTLKTAGSPTRSP